MNLFQNSDEIAKGLGQGLFRGPNMPQEPTDPFSSIAQQQQEPVEEEKPSILADLAMAPFRGVEGAAHGLYNLADTIAFDALPDWSEDSRVLGRSRTMAGGFVEGLSQFLVPFFPLKAAMKLGKVGKTFAKLGTKRSDMVRDITAGSIVDFAAFDGQEERLSNLINLSPLLKNQVTEYLAANEDDAELEGRIKNTMEGLMIEGGMRGSFGVIGAVFSGIKAVKLRQKKLAEGKDPEQAAQEAINESGVNEVDYSQMDFQYDGPSTKTPEDYGMPTIAGQLGLNLDPKQVMGRAPDDLDVQGEQLNLDMETPPTQREMFDEDGNLIPPSKVVHHGSAHRFNEFKTSKIDSGEGGQYFGYGLYFAGSKEVANYYRTAGAPDQLKGNLYRVELDVPESSMLEFDTSFKEMDAKKRASINTAVGDTVDELVRLDAEATGIKPEDSQFFGYNKNVDNLDRYKNWRELYFEIMDADPKANAILTKNLQKQGFEGIKFLDGLSRSGKVKEKNYNYVVFDDSKVRVLDRNGQPVKTSTPRNRPLVDLPYRQKVEGWSTKEVLDDQVKQWEQGVDVIETRRLAFSEDDLDEMYEKVKEAKTFAEFAGDKGKSIDVTQEFKWFDEIRKDLGGRGDPNLPDWRPTNYFEDMGPVYSEGVIEDAGFSIAYYKIGQNAKGHDVHLKVDMYNLDGDLTFKIYEHGEEKLVLPRKDVTDDAEFMELDALMKDVANDFLAKPEVQTDQLELGLRNKGEPLDRPTTEEGAKLDSQQADAKNLEPQNTEDMSYKEIQTLAKELGVNAKGKRIEIEARIEEHYKKAQEEKLPSVGEDGQLEMFEGQAQGQRKPIQLSPEYKALKNKQGTTGRNPIKDSPSGFQSVFKFFHDEKFLDDNADYTEGWTGKKTFTESKHKSMEETVLKIAKQLQASEGDRGGEQALLGSIRNVANQGGLMMVAKALAMNIEKGAKETPATFESIIKEAEEIAEEMGQHQTQHGHLAKIVDAEKAGEGSIAALKTLRANQQAIRTINRTIGNALRDKAAEMHELKKNGGKKGDPDYHVLETELLTLLDKHRSSQQLWSIYGRETSKVMLQRRAYYAGSSPYNRRLGLSGQQVLNGADRMHYKKKQIGSMTTDELVDKIRAAPNGDAVFKILNKTTEGTEGSKMMRITLEYWMNSLLSSPVTQLVNVLGAAGIYHMKAAEGIMGAAINGDVETMKSIAKNLYKNESIKEAWAHAVIALKTDDAILAPDARTYDDSIERSHAISSDREDAFGSAINFIGTLVRTPSRALIAGDEFFKQLNYRFFIRSEVMADSLRKGDTMERAVVKAEQAMEAAVTKGGTAMNERSLGMEVYKQVQKQDDQRVEMGQARMTPEEFDQTLKETFETQIYRVRDSRLNMEMEDPRYRTTDAALDYAKESTATKDIPQVQEPLARLAHWFPPAKMVFPFVRTPTNLLKMGFERTALGGVASFVREGLHGEVLKGYREIMANGTKREQAQLKGKMATSVATSAALITYISANGQFISGGGPRNRDEREALKLEGWQPYSIKVGDKWRSYRRLDPISTTMGILADIAEIPKYYDVDVDTAEGLFTLLSVSFMNNITQQSFVQGVDDLFKVVSDPVTYGPRFLGNISGGFVPNALNWSQNLGGDRMLRETRSIFDHVLARVPSGARDLPPRRNFLGEAQIINEGGNMLSAFNPLFTSPVKETPLNSEVARMLHGFAMPDSKIGGADNLDLKKMRTRTGQDAYDRYLELSGTVKLGDKTLREQLSALVEHPNYQLLPDDDIADETGLRNPRVRAMSKILRHYRLAARHELYNEMPALRQAIASNDAQRRQYLNQ